MKTSKTAGGLRDFTYSGDLRSGFTIHFGTSNLVLPAGLFTASLEQFRGKTVKGGFNMVTPPVDGFGHFVRAYGRTHMERAISPRYASHVAAILRDEELVEITKDGRSVVLTFL